MTKPARPLIRRSKVEGGSRNVVRAFEKLAPSNPKIAQANIDRWAKLPLWTWYQATYLALGILPHTGSESRAAQELLEHIDLAQKAGEFDGDDEPSFNSGEYVRPLAFIAWCDKNLIPFSSGLRVAVEARAKTVKAPADLNPKERSSLYRIIYILSAARKVEFTETDVPAKVRAILAGAETCGISMDDETARKYLKAAIEYVDRSAK